MPVALMAHVSLLVAKRQKFPCALGHLLINQNYTEFFCWRGEGGAGTSQVTAKPTPGKIKGRIFNIAFNMCNSRTRTCPLPRHTAIRTAMLLLLSQMEYKQGFMYTEICRKLNIYSTFV